MTAVTTFKEFVEEKDLNFSLLDFGSPEYRSLVKAFNKAKLKLEAEEEAREYEKERARLMLNGRFATKDLRSRRARRPEERRSFRWISAIANNFLEIEGLKILLANVQLKIVFVEAPGGEPPRGDYRPCLSDCGRRFWAKALF